MILKQKKQGNVCIFGPEMSRERTKLPTGVCVSAGKHQYKVPPDPNVKKEQVYLKSAYFWLHILYIL